MSNTDEVFIRSAPSLPLRLPLRRRLLAGLWAALVLGYLLASISGQRAAALALVGLMFGALLAVSGQWLAGLALGLVLAASCIYWADTLGLMAYLPPLAAFAFMAVIFARTLQPGREPLITSVARCEYTELPAGVADYTRTLTAIWAACFAGLFATALLLIWLLPLAQWARWVQALGYIVPGALFLVEYAYRHRHFPARPHASLPRLIMNIVSVMNEAALRPAALPVADSTARDGAR